LDIAETARLRLRWFNADDSEFILDLLNEPSWIRFIGDKGVKTLDDARRYIQDGPIAMYSRVGFGLYAVELKPDGQLIGMCGLIKRDTLEDVDLGFALLPKFWRSGYAFEAATAVMSYGRKVLGLGRVVAILSPDNDRSSKLLEKLGFRFERAVRFQPTHEELHLYAAAARPRVMPEDSMTVEGSCHCGKVTYRAEIDPAKTSLCNCTDCQMLTGSAFRVSVPAAKEHFRLISGQPRTYIKTADSGAQRIHAFCTDCGTPIYACANIDDPPTYSLRVGCLKQRARLAPKKRIWCKSALEWAQNISAIPAVDEQ